MDWKERHRSFYYKHAEQPDDISLQRCDTAHLIIDVQKTYLEEKPNSTENKEWQPFYAENIVPYLKSMDKYLKNKVNIILGGGRKVDFPDFKNIENVKFVKRFEDFDKMLATLNQ